MGLLKKRVDVGKMKNEGDTEALASLLKHKEQNIRREAAKALGELRDPSVVTPLVNSLVETDSIAFLEKVRALGSIGAPAIDILLQALNSKEHKIRKGAIAALGRIGDERAAKPIIRILKHESHLDMKLTEIRALGRIGSAEAIDQLIRELKKSFEKVRFPNFQIVTNQEDIEAIVLVLLQIGKPSIERLERLLDDTNPRISKGAREILEGRFHWKDRQTRIREKETHRPKSRNQRLLD